MKLPDQSESFCFDFFSILAVKLNNSSNDTNQKNFLNCLGSFEDQLGKEKCSEVLDSEEYKELYKINLDTFDAIENIRINGDIMSVTVFHELNDQRTLAKKRLQKRFFPNSEMTEVKTLCTKS
jgi:hypothetical protein